ncbi:MAG TPA: branched-chain amino acid ABC transporter permease [Actinomycetota bacterium]|jgi:branched-chain amino acid transport system permease protein
MRTATVIGVIAALVGAVLFFGRGDELGPNPYVVIGFVSGAVYGLVALGLVLVYKGSRVFNFAQGEFGTMAAFIAFFLTEQFGERNIPLGLAVVVAIVAVVLIGLLMERVLVRPLLNASRINLLVGTIAFALFCIAIEILVFLPEVKTLQPIVQGINEQGLSSGLTLFAHVVSPQEMIAIGTLLFFAIVFAYFFSRTDLGLAILATSQDEFATRVVGIGVERTSRFIWGGAAFLGAIAGILYAPIAGLLVPGVVTTGVLIPAFTAAVIGGMTSLPGAFVGGVVVGLIQNLSQWASNHYHIGEKAIQEIVPSLPDVMLVLALLLVLLARPQGLLGSEA